MTRSIFKATTALTITLSLVQPGPMLAQVPGAAARPLHGFVADDLRTPERAWLAQVTCETDPTLPECVVPGMTSEEPATEAPAEGDAAPKKKKNKNKAAAQEEQPAAEPSEPVTDPATAAETDPPAAVEPGTIEPDAAAPVEPAPEPKDKPKAKKPKVPKAQVEAEPEPEPDTKAQDTIVPEDVQEDPAVEQAAPSDAPSLKPAADAAPETAPAESGAAKKGSDGAKPSGKSPKKKPKEQPEPAAGADAATGPAPEAEPVIEPTAEQKQVLDTLLADPEVAAAVETLSKSAASDATADQGTAPADAAIRALAAGVGGPAPVETTRQTLDEKRARKSNQDFKTKLKTTAPTTVEDDDDDLSDLEKAGLLALGAVAVGMLINNSRVVANSGDRVVVDRGDGNLAIWKDDNANLRAPGVVETTQRFEDGSTLSTMDRPDGTQIITIRDATGRVIRRDLVQVDGRRVPIIDDTRPSRPVEVAELPRPRLRELQFADDADPALMRALLDDAARTDLGRTFSLAQVRDVQQVRELAPELTSNPITFATGSAAIPPEQAGRLARLAALMNEMIDENPGEVFLIEGHTDAVGNSAYNLALSDRRAESVALALSEVFDVPPENMIVQGYGERFLRVASYGDEPRNRRVAIRNITWLVDGV